MYFNLNGIEGTTPKTQYLKQGTIGIRPVDPTIEGYIFKGWDTNIDGSGLTWNFSTEKMPSNDVILYAQWEKTENIDSNSISTTVEESDKLPKMGGSSNKLRLNILLTLLGLTVVIIAGRE